MNDAGFYKEEGLDVDTIYIPSSPIAAKATLVKAAGFQVTLNEIGRSNPKAKQAKPQQFFDNSLVQELVDEGFFARLWGKTPQ
jgi:hypothetical protein